MRTQSRTAVTRRTGCSPVTRLTEWPSPPIRTDERPADSSFNVSSPSAMRSGWTS